MQRRIMIGCPSGAGHPHYTTNLCSERMIMEGLENGWQVDHYFRGHDSMITRARDVIFSNFYHEPTYTDLFFLDDDVACRPGSFTRIMNHPVDLVGGAYRGKREPEEYTIRALPSGEDGRHLQFDPETKLMEVEAVATGFMRITRKCAETFVNADPDAWYYDCTAPKDMKVFSIFDNYLDRPARAKWSEDYYFCRKYRELGGRVWVDPMLELDHTGEKTFTGCLFDYLKRTQPKIEEPPILLLDHLKGILAEHDKPQPEKKAAA